MTPQQLMERRLALGFSQIALGEALGVKPQTVGRWESGARGVPDGLDQELSQLEADFDASIASALAGETKYPDFEIPWPQVALLRRIAQMVRNS